MRSLARTCLFIAVVLFTLIAPGTAAQTPPPFVCPVTYPNTEELMGLPSFHGDGKAYNQDDLWIVIPADGILEFDPESQSLSNEPGFEGWMDFKLHVYRGNTARGTVNIVGIQLDVPSAPRTVSSPGVAEYYGDSGFVPVSLVVPQEGCWEFTAVAGSSSATWVVDVRFVDAVATPVP